MSAMEMCLTCTLMQGRICRAGMPMLSSTTDSTICGDYEPESHSILLQEGRRAAISPKKKR